MSWGSCRLRPAPVSRSWSVNLLLEHETDPVVWRGPVIAGTVTQFWTDVVWGDVDYMFVDMPPGTGDVALTVFQSLPVDGIIIVTSPQDLVSMIVEKAVKMAGLMNVPILGLVENMSYFTCPDCGKKISVFGESTSMRSPRLIMFRPRQTADRPGDCKAVRSRRHRGGREQCARQGRRGSGGLLAE